MLYLFVALKIPIAAAIYIVWWAVKQEPDPDEDARDDGGTKKRPHPVPKRGPEAPAPRPARRARAALAPARAHRQGARQEAPALASPSAAR